MCSKVYKIAVHSKVLYKLQVVLWIVYGIYGIMITNVWNMNMKMEYEYEICVLILFEYYVGKIK